MIKPISLYIGLRYIRAKRRTRFVSFISLVSVLGIALGVTALITVLSVLNGFNHEISQQFFSTVPAITVSSAKQQDWKALAKEVKSFDGVQASARFISGKAMLMNRGLVSGVEVMGVLPLQEKTVSVVPDSMIAGHFNDLQSGKYNMVLGTQLAASLGLSLGDKVNLLTPQTTTTPFGVLPRFRQLTVGGIFKTGNGFGFDSSVAYIHLLDAKKLYPGSEAMKGLHVKLIHPMQAREISTQLNAMLPSGVYASNWTQVFGTFFKTLAMEKTMMFVILLLIVAVAAFNLVSSLMMSVNDKRTDIAVLRTLGATPKTILLIFIIQGGLIGLIGTFIGIVGGILLALNATGIVNWIQGLLDVQFISSSVYFVDYLPSRLEWLDVLRISTLAWGLSLLATIYPAWAASRTQPAEALRYE